MKILGITGGVGSGKSTVLAYLKEKWGASCVLCDDIGRRLQEKGGSCYAFMTEMFGPSCLHEDGSLDRAAIAAQVFAAPTLLERVNSVIHPAVRREVERLAEEERQRGTKLFVIEAALLLEADFARMCDCVWYIYADAESRMVRLARNRGYSRERAQKIMSAQRPDSFYRERCGRVIDNSFEGFSSVRAQIDRALLEDGLVSAQDEKIR